MPIAFMPGFLTIGFDGVEDHVRVVLMRKGLGAATAADHHSKN